jgi:hypothetical protein
MQVLDDGIQIEALEFLGVVEGRAQRIRLRGMLIEELYVQPLWPPVAVAS